jgi:hypothetical protein
LKEDQLALGEYDRGPFAISEYLTASWAMDRDCIYNHLSVAKDCEIRDTLTGNGPGFRLGHKPLWESNSVFSKKVDIATQCVPPPLLIQGQV